MTPIHIDMKPTQMDKLSVENWCQDKWTTTWDNKGVQSEEQQSSKCITYDV